jgi:hypothetical protein
VRVPIRPKPATKLPRSATVGEAIDAMQRERDRLDAAIQWLRTLTGDSGADAMAGPVTVEQVDMALSRKVDQLTEQLIACALATTPSKSDIRLKKGDYRWSEPYESVVKLAHDCERATVQLAGCVTAATGWSVAGQEAHEGDYGWSPAYGDVLKLRRAFEKLANGRSPQQVLEDAPQQMLEDVANPEVPTPWVPTP